MKKTLLLALTLSFMIACLAGCGTSPSGPDGGISSPPPDGASENPPPPPAGNIEGSLPDILARMNAIYAERDDVKTAQAQIDEFSPRMEELNEIIWSDDHGLDDEELTRLVVEAENLSEHLSNMYKLLPAFTMDAVLTPQGTEDNDNIAYFIGADDIPFIEGYVSEGMMAYSVVLLRMEPGSDIQGAMARIKNGVDPMKWICAGVDPSDVIVDNIGDLVILIMADNSKQLHEAFLELSK
jgi:hypothetical protein